jgi:hypothetical protein
MTSMPGACFIQWLNGVARPATDEHVAAEQRPPLQPGGSDLDLRQCRHLVSETIRRVSGRLAHRDIIRQRSGRSARPLNKWDPPCILDSRKRVADRLAQSNDRKT